jgi:hypothetical protein
VLVTALVKALDKYLQEAAAAAAATPQVVVEAVRQCLMAAMAARTLCLWFRFIM